MSQIPYLTAPAKTTGMPRGIPYIIANEAGERFCYYGLRGILVIVMTKYLLDRTGRPANMTEEEAKGWYHLFVSAAYFFPLFGAILSDMLWGKYRTILSLSCVYCVGCGFLTFAHTKWELIFALLLIAIGSGGIKPCVSAHVGDQFASTNSHLVSRAFGWFYLSVNFGSSFSMYFVPIILKAFGTERAFGLPAVLMVLATGFFWMGRYKFAHIPAGGREFLKESLSPAGLRRVAKLVPLYFFVIIFWSLYDQSSSAWVLQAEHLNLHWLKPTDWDPAQVQVANPVFVLILIPFYTYIGYPLIDRVFKLSPLRKIGIGLFLTFLSFCVPAELEVQLAHGLKPSVGWQFFAYVLLTSGEVMVAVTFLEFSYTQSPKTMKSFVMSLYLLSISFGNAFTAIINFIIEKAHWQTWLTGANYYLFFAALMIIANACFVVAATRYREQNYLQE
jgi:POT family proton-dependent oligopeptide transporter